MQKIVIVSVVLFTVLSNNFVAYAMKPNPSPTGIQPAQPKPNMPQFRRCNGCGNMINAQSVVCGFCGKRK